MDRLNLVCLILCFLKKRKSDVSLGFDHQNFRPGDHYNILLEMKGIFFTTFISFHFTWACYRY